MSSASDQTVFSESVEPQNNANLFEQKKWAYITDSNSPNGSFGSQLQFSLQQFQSQNFWFDLSQTVITFPIKLSIANVDAFAPANAPSILAATIKAGFHHFIDQCQVNVGNSTLQNSIPFVNIDATYKILTEWNKDTLTKWGPTLGVALDDIISSTDANTGIAESVDNLPLVTATNGVGFTPWNTKNPGIKERLVNLNNAVGATALGRSILGVNQPLLGKANVETGTSAAAGADIFVLYALGTIRLKDVSDCISKLPMMKGLKGYVYLNYNNTTHTLNNSNATTITSVSSIGPGKCCAGILNTGMSTTSGFQFNAAAHPLTFKAEISAVPSLNLTTAGPVQQNAFMYVPYYVATPEIDRALTQKKTIRYMERYTSDFPIGKNGSFSGTVSSGITNPKRIILYPYFTGAGDSGNSGFLANPLISPFDSAPSTTSPFAALSQLQVTVGNQPMWNQPVSMDWQAFCNEVGQTGMAGGQVDQASSGLLSQRTWNQLYRYYTCDIGRRMNSEDGASKSIQVSCNNATSCPMRVQCIIWYEKVVTVDTAAGFITSGM